MLAGVRRSVSRRGRSPRARARPAPIAMSPARPVARPPIAPSRARRLDGTLRWRCDLGVSVMGGRLAVGRAGRMCGTVARRRPATSAGCSDRIGVPVIPANRHRVAPVDREGRAAGLLRAVERGIGVGHQPVGAWPCPIGRRSPRYRWRPIPGRPLPSNGIGRSILRIRRSTGRRWPPPRRCRATRRGTRPRPRAPPCPARAGPPRRIFETSLSTWSPAAWPWVSFTSLKKSRSRCRSANSAFGSSSRRRNSVSIARRLASPSTDRSAPGARPFRARRTGGPSAAATGAR
jgi:hypothetical protein